MRRNAARLSGLTLLLATVACDLTDVEIVDFAEVVVAEVYVTVADDPALNRLRAFIHGTAPGSQPSSQTFDDAVVTVTDGDGVRSVLGPSVIDGCVGVRPEDSSGTCFVADFFLAVSFEGGDTLVVEVTLADGRMLSGSTRIPGDFRVDGIGGDCRVIPNTRLPLRWSRSNNASAYLSEALITGLPAALVSEGIEAPDSLFLLGLSISETDTTVVFPREFGVFDRLDLAQDLAVRLQDGLPAGASADLAITAVGQNYVNWVRGGSFNPSGTVRVSSLVGDGSGVFGAAVTRRFTILSSADTAAGLLCGRG
jgi:hypothetical protein